MASRSVWSGLPTTLLVRDQSLVPRPGDAPVCPTRGPQTGIAIWRTHSAFTVAAVATSLAGRYGRSSNILKTLVADAVQVEPLSPTEFPASREKNRDFFDLRPLFQSAVHVCPMILGAKSKISCSFEQGNSGAEQGISAADQGIHLSRGGGASSW